MEGMIVFDVAAQKGPAVTFCALPTLLVVQVPPESCVVDPVSDRATVLGCFDQLALHRTEAKKSHRTASPTSRKIVTRIVTRM